MSQKWRFYNNIDDIHPTLITLVHIEVSVFHFFLSDTFISRRFLSMLFHQLLWKINPSIFWWNQLKHHNTLPYCQKLIFIVLTRLYNFSIALILFLISKHNNLVKSEQQNWSYSISQSVHFWFDKLAPPSGVMYFCESCWIFFQYLYTLFLISIFLF